MERNGMVLVILLLFTIFLFPSDALRSRKLVEVSDQTVGSSGNQDAPSSSPPPDDKKSNISPDAKTKPKDAPSTTPSNVESKGLNDANNKTGSETFSSKSCKGKLICSDQKKSLIACIEDFESGSNKLTLIVKNEQDTDLNVNITFGTTTNNNLPPFGIHGHGTEMVNITLPGDKNTKVILDAGNGGCELQFDSPNIPPVNNPSNSKDSKNTPNPKDIDNPANSHEKPKDVDNQTKPKDTNNPKEDDIPVKDDKPDNNPNPKKDPKLPVNVDTPPKPPNEVNDTSKSKDVIDPSKSKEVNDPSKVKDGDDPSKSKEVDDPSKSKDVEDPSKSKDVIDPSKSNDSIVDTPTSRNNILDQLTFYSKQVTPIYGAYFAFLVALIIGASWALCSFRKRRTDNGVPYQELEMGLPESSNAVNVETAEGWDQDWDDDDWDEDKAIRSPGGGIHSKSISSNGLTSRATEKDDWDANWDD